MNKNKVVCFGEILWDSMPHGLFVGGAPFNVAFHLSQLGQDCMLISAIGKDELGRLALDKANQAEVDTSCIHISDTLPTGIADIEFDDNGDAKYDIRNPAAWDEIPLTEITKEKLVDCQALVFGSLSARSEISRQTLFELLDDFQGLKICDINLRKPYDDVEFALLVARKATIVKLNEEEIYRLSGIEKSSSTLENALSEFKKKCGCAMVFLTRGGEAPVYFDGERMMFASPPPSDNVVDTVGAGDAFTAGITKALLENVSIEACLERGVRLGSFVASKAGAQPKHEKEKVSP